MSRSLNYANVTATLALVFAMSGGALAAKHYLINSTKQINPKVLKALANDAAPDTKTFTKLAATTTVAKASFASTAASAASAASASSATNATNAANATNADHATSADNSGKLGGVSAGSYLQKTAQPGQVLTGQLDARYVANSSFTPAGASYSVPLPGPPAKPTVIYLPETVTTPACPGIGQSVTPGTLCIYGYNSLNVEQVGTSGGSEGLNSRYGFSVDVLPQTAASYGYLIASWAYKVQ